VRDNQPADPAVEDQIQKPLQSPFAVVHPRAEILDHLEGPALGRTVRFEPLGLPFQVVLLIVAGSGFRTSAEVLKPLLETLA